MPKGVYDRKTALDQAEAPETAVDPMAELEAMKAELARQLEATKALNAKLEMQTAVRSEVSEALRLQQEETKRQAFGKPTLSAAEPMPPKPDEDLVSIKLDKNYRPMGYYEVAGWHKDEIKRKNAAGNEVVVERAEFIEGERKPPVVAGTGFPNKVWAGTVLRVPKSEVAHIRKNGIGSIELD